MFISLHQKWNGQFQILFLTKYRNKVKDVSKHLAACLYKEHQEEALKMFLEEHQILSKSTHWTSEGKPLRAKEKMAQVTIDEQPFSWLELPDNFSSSNKRTYSEDEESMHLDGTSLLASKTIDFLNDKEKIEHETKKYLHRKKQRWKVLMDKIPQCCNNFSYFA